MKPPDCITMWSKLPTDVVNSQRKPKGTCSSNFSNIYTKSGVNLLLFLVYLPEILQCNSQSEITPTTSIQNIHSLYIYYLNSAYICIPISSNQSINNIHRHQKCHHRTIRHLSPDRWGVAVMYRDPKS